MKIDLDVLKKKNGRPDPSLSVQIIISDRAAPDRLLKMQLLKYKLLRVEYQMVRMYIEYQILPNTKVRTEYQILSF